MKKENTQSALPPANMKMPGMHGPRNRQQVEKPLDGKETISRMVHYFSREKKMILLLMGAVLVVVVCSVYAPSLLSQAIDMITQKQFGSIPRLLVLMIVLYLIYSLCNLLQGILSARLSQNIVEKMRNDLFEKITRLPIRYMDTHSHGDIMSRMTNDVENISNTISQSLSSLFSGVLTILGTMGMMIYFCWQLAILSCVTMVLTIIGTKLLSGVMRRFYRKRQVLLGAMNGTVEEMVVGYKTVVAYNQQQSVLDDFETISDDLTHTGIVAEILGGSMGPMMNCINNIGFVIIAAFGGYFAIHGLISVGVISAFIVYAKQFGRPIEELAQIYGQIQTAVAGAERVFAVMDEPDEIDKGTNAMDNTEGMISFRHVNFSYEPGKEVLHDFSLDIPAGHKIALVGATGSGKTTVVNLLMRFYEIDSGHICIDNVDLSDFDLDELRRNIAIVLQDTVLFTETVKENLMYGNRSATNEQLEKASQMSNCSNMIRHLPKGYNTILTESGSNLSQGQRQLLSIGRAFLASPKILILDEATSSVDTRTEKHIQDAMVNLMKNRTSLIIAHRLSTIHDADQIVVMDQGRIVETGNHQELMNRKGRYYSLYMTQFAGNQI